MADKELIKKQTAFEKYISGYLGKLTYAVVADLEISLGIPPEGGKYQNYNNLIKPKEERARVPNRFTISIEACQYFRIMFFNKVKEVTDPKAAITPKDDISIIQEKLLGAVPNSYTTFIIQFVSEMSKKIDTSATLCKADDPTRGLNNSFIEYIPMWSGYDDMAILVLLCQQFDRFIRTMAWLCGRNILFNKLKKVTGPMCLAEFSKYSMPAQMIQTLVTQLRPKAVRVPKEKGKKGPSVIRGSEIVALPINKEPVPDNVDTKENVGIIDV